MMYNIAVVGATGMVGRKFLDVLEELNFPINNLYLYSSKKSAGTRLQFKGCEYIVEELCEENIKSKNINIALFSAGADVSLSFSKIFVSYGAVVIDNSSAFRMYNDIPLVVPEVNAEDILLHKGIIANPNCSTIQAVVALKPLQDRYGIKRIVYSTYQAVSGAGMLGYNDLKEGILGKKQKKFPYAIAYNLIPQIDVFLEDGYTKEEHKMINETKKILHDDNFKITATTVRVPVFYGHSESINIELKKSFTLEEIQEIYKNSKGIILKDDFKSLEYPMPIDCEGKDEVFIGRIRKDNSIENGLNLFVVADNIRKGAATNAVQIAFKLIEYMEGEMI